MEPRRSGRGSGQTSRADKLGNATKQGVNAMQIDLLKRTLERVSCGAGWVTGQAGGTHRTLAILTSPFRPLSPRRVTCGL